MSIQAICNLSTKQETIYLDPVIVKQDLSGLMSGAYMSGGEEQVLSRPGNEL